jgi:GntR family transcriptional regulator, phosphonate transport system regulatory protein
VGRESWRRIRDGLAAEIDRGTLPLGAQLPTESALCAQFETGRHSVRRAVQALAIEGKLRVVQGRGTFVESAPLIQYAIGRRTRFRQNLLDQGLTPSGEHLAAETLAAPAHVATALELAKGAMVHRLLRRGLADGVPVSLGLSWHPADVFPGLIEQRMSGLSVTQVYAAHGIADYYRKRTEIFARRPEGEESRLLAQHPDQPVLVVVKTDVTPDGRVIGHSEAVWSADRVRFTIDTLDDEAPDA